MRRYDFSRQWCSMPDGHITTVWTLVGGIVLMATLYAVVGFLLFWSVAPSIGAGASPSIEDVRIAARAMASMPMRIGPRYWYLTDPKVSVSAGGRVIVNVLPIPAPSPTGM